MKNKKTDCPSLLLDLKTSKIRLPQNTLDYVPKDVLRQLLRKDFNFIHLNLDGKIIFPKELDMVLNYEELFKLEDQLYLSKQISDQEYIFYDQDKNIRVGFLLESLDLVYKKAETLDTYPDRCHDLDYVNIEEITCDHDWQKYVGTDNFPCIICKLFPHKKLRAKCLNCHHEACIRCLEKKNLIAVEPDFLNTAKDLDNQEIRVLRKIVESIEDTVRFFSKETRPF